MPNGKIIAFVGSGNAGVTLLNTLHGPVTLGGTLGFTAPHSGSTITITPPQDLQVSASPTFGGMLVASSAGSPGVISALTPASGYTYALDVVGPIRAQAGIISFETANPTGDPTNFGAVIYNKTSYGPVLSGFKAAIYTGGSGSTATIPSLSIDDSGNTVLNRGNLTIGSTSFTGSQAVVVNGAGAFDNTHNYSPTVSLLGAGATSAQAVTEHFHPVAVDHLVREGALVAGVVIPSGSTGWEGDGLISMVTNASATTEGVCASLFALVNGSGAQVWAINSSLRDWDNENTALHVPGTLLGWEADLSIADTGTKATVLSANIEWKNGKPTPPRHSAGSGQRRAQRRHVSGCVLRLRL